MTYWHDVDIYSLDNDIFTLILCYRIYIFTYHTVYVPINARQNWPTMSNEETPCIEPSLGTKHLTMFHPLETTTMEEPWEEENNKEGRVGCSYDVEIWAWDLPPNLTCPQSPLWFWQRDVFSPLSNPCGQKRSHDEHCGDLQCIIIRTVHAKYICTLETFGAGFYEAFTIFVSKTTNNL